MSDPFEAQCTAKQCLYLNLSLRGVPETGICSRIPHGLVVTITVKQAVPFIVTINHSQSRLVTDKETDTGSDRGTGTDTGTLTLACNCTASVQ